MPMPTSGLHVGVELVKFFCSEHIVISANLFSFRLTCLPVHYSPIFPCYPWSSLPSHFLLAPSLCIDFYLKRNSVFTKYMCILNLHKRCCALNHISCSFGPTLCFSALVPLLCGTSSSLPLIAACLHTSCLSNVSWLIHCFSLPSHSHDKQLFDEHSH